MTYDELANAMVEVATDTSDPITSNFANIFKNLPDERLMLREIIYLKAFLCSFVVVSTDSNKEQAKQVGYLMLNKFENYFGQNDCGCGANHYELVKAYKFYWDKYFSYCSDYLQLTKYNPAAVINKGLLFKAFMSCKDFFKFLDKDYHKSDYIADSGKFFEAILDTYTKIEEYLTEKQNPSCFVATATYNNPMHPDVIYLRYFRDYYLSKTLFGQLFIKFYYLVGPYLAVLPKRFSVIKKISRSLIEKIVGILKQHYKFNC